ncbi:MAG TPA: hypothetical protein VK823_19030 [Streptosporangiaceae bacterium]|nr:hypothetical protein [Streptosporangiaceae bacterium]
MSSAAISTEGLSYRKHVRVAGTQMAYVDVGVGDPIVFLIPVRPVAAHGQRMEPPVSDARDP